MKTTKNGWTIVDETAGIASYEYTFNGGATANTFAARMPNGKLMIVSPGCGLPDGAYADLAALGDVGALVANNGYHHLGQGEWRTRFPSARCFAPQQTADRVKKKSGLDFEPLSALAELAGKDVAVVEAPSTKVGETWAWAKTSSGGYAWFTSDLIANIEKLPSNIIFKSVFKLTKSAPGYRVFNLAFMLIVKDKKKVLQTMLADMQAHPPTIVVPGHGAVLERPGLENETKALVSNALS